MNKILNVSGAMAFFAALGSLFAVVLAMWGITGQMRALLTQKTQLLKLTVDLANLDQILSDEKSFAVVMQRVSATLPKEYSDVASAILAIERTAKANNLPTDFAIDEKPKPETGDLTSLTITMKTSGLYGDISKFARDLALLPYHTRMDSLVFEEAGGKVTAAMMIRLFMQ